jgi:hypothetical protein
MYDVVSKRNYKNTLMKYLLIFFSVYITNFLYIPISIIFKIPQNIQLGVSFCIFISFSVSLGFCTDILQREDGVIPNSFKNDRT